MITVELFTQNVQSKKTDLLSILVFAADTWFHFATKSVNLIQVYPNYVPSNHSVGLTSNCYDVKTPFAVGCTINPAATATFLMNGQNTLSVIANLSETMRIHTISRGNDIYSYVGNPPSNLLDSTDYTAHSWALETHCAPVTSKCINEGQISGAATAYKCPFAMEGTLFTPKSNVMTMAYFTDKTGTSNDTQFSSLQNPSYFAAIVAVNQNFGHGRSAEGEVTSTVHGADLFALFCNSTVYDLEYTSVNGTITRFIITPSNTTVINIVQGSQQYTNVGDPVILQGASIGALISTSGQGVADYFALTYSQTALGVASAAFEPRSAIESQQRETILVARIPIAPLACLLVANLSLVVLGVILTILALWAARGETREVQARLSIPGLVAAQFEGTRAVGAVEDVRDLFEERGGGSGPRIGIVKSDEGGWKFHTWSGGRVLVR